ncbi:MgtC/SapB family protein [Clostridiaceae bacterium]|nr:MgtC/SapB family protein [Clostridiaceae bacterium]RKI16485.1 MgtC/SapB family protein [bacterium 1XD21-70]
MFFSSLTEWTPYNVMLRIVVSLFLGSLIGIDRGVKRRGAGSRTDAAVCLGSTLVMLTAQYMNLKFPGKTDISRMASQVISGVGFLGAGSILVSRHQVKGLTSAAGVWICACIGLAVGIGFVDGAVVVTALLLAGLHILPVIEERVYHYSRYMTLYIETEDSRAVTRLLHKIKADGCKVDMYNVERPKAAGQSFTVMITARIGKNMGKEAYVQSLSEFEGVVSVDSL